MNRWQWLNIERGLAGLSFCSPWATLSTERYVRRVLCSEKKERASKLEVKAKLSRQPELLFNEGTL